MKMHWGSGLVLVFLAFAAGIIAIVAISMNERVDLVADDYYELELDHQKQIEMMKRSEPLRDSIHFASSHDGILIRFPISVNPEDVYGTLECYRPSDRSMDKTIPLSLDSSRSQLIADAMLPPGLWRLKMRWTVRETDYFREEVINRVE